MRRTLAVTLLLLLASSCMSAAPSPQAGGLTAEAVERYTALVVSTESQVQRCEVAQTRAESAAERAESAAERAEDAAAVETLEALVEAMNSPQQTISPSGPSLDSTGTDADATTTASESADLNAKADILIRSEVAVGYDFLYFSAAWCQACRNQAPVLEELRDAGYRIRMVDIDTRPELAAMFHVAAVPAYVAFVDGKTVLDGEGLPKISHGLFPVANSKGWRVDSQAVLDLIGVDPQRPSSAPLPAITTPPALKQIAAGHNWRRSPAYVGFAGNMNRQDYLDHLVDDHGCSANEFVGWTAFELFQLHSALHCPNCSRRISR